MADFIQPLVWQGHIAQVPGLGLAYHWQGGRLHLGETTLGPAPDLMAAKALAQSDLQARIMSLLSAQSQLALTGIARARHMKRGSHYRVLGKGRLQTGTALTDDAELVIYRAEEGGALWARPQQEFTDGRFEIAGDLGEGAG